MDGIAAKTALADRLRVTSQYLPHTTFSPVVRSVSDTAPRPWSDVLNENRTVTAAGLLELVCVHATAGVTAMKKRPSGCRIADPSAAALPLRIWIALYARVPLMMTSSKGTAREIARPNAR